MSSNVTPIRGAGPSEPPAPPAKARQRRRKTSTHLRLIARVEGEPFNTLCVVNGLRGVCRAIDHYAIEDFDEEQLADLAQAARVLSAMVAQRVD